MPDVGVRVWIRRLLRQRLREAAHRPQHRKAVDDLRHGAISPSSALANAPRHEVPAAFFQAVLGPRMKCSSSYWSPEVEDLAGAETAMLELVAERTRLADGLTILDLGCGWGSFALWAAERYPSSRIVAVSNSPSETAFIDARAAEREIVNLTTHTADISNFEPGQSFDRIISIEVFEHLQSYESLLRRLRSWLLPGGRLFVHLVCHRKFSYRFEDDGPGNWMGREFFAAGFMPASDTLPAFQTDLRLERQWHVNGRHYRSTARAWLNNLDANRVAAAAALAGGSDEIKRAELDRRVQRWRIFLMACEEMFGFADCAEWEVCHYLFASRLDALSAEIPARFDAA